MAYQPPLNGGRINASIGGNSTSAGAGYSLISTGTMHLHGGNNVTLAQNGNTVSISGPSGSSLSATGIVSVLANGSTLSIGAPAYSAGMSTGGNTGGTSGFATNQLVFQGGNNITLSQSTGAGGNTLAFHAGGGGLALANSETTYATGTAQLLAGTGAITINSTTGQKFQFNVPGVSGITGTGIVSVSSNGSVISIGAPANAVSGSNGSYTYQTLSMSNANGISFGTSAGSAVTASHNGLTSQSAQALSGSNGSFAFQTATFGNLNGMSFYTSNGSLVGSYTVPTQTNQNLSLSAVGNTTQTSTGTMNATNMYLSGAGNVSIGYSNGSAIISGGGGGGGGGAAFSAGTQSVSTGTVNFANSNGVTFGMSNSNQITASVATTYAASNHSHGNPAFNFTNLSATTGSNSNGLTLSLSANPLGIGGFQAGTQQASTGTINFANSNGLTFGMANSSIVTASHNGITSQTNQNITFSAFGNTTNNTSGTLNATGLIFNGAGNVSVGMSNGSVVISGTGGGGGGGIALSASNSVFTSGTVSLANAGGALTIGTAGQQINFSVPSASSISATGIVSVSSNGTVLSIGAPAFSAGMSNIGNTTGTSGMLTNRLVLAGGSNILLSQSNDANGATISIGQSAGGGGGGVGIAASNQTATSGTMNFVNSNGVTFGMSGSSQMTASVPAVSNLSGAGAVTIQTAGNVISIGAPVASIARWEYPTQGFGNLGALISTNTLSMQHVNIPYNLTATAARLVASMNMSALTTTGTATVNANVRMGVYTLSGSTLSLLASGSTLNSWSNSVSGANVSNSYNGMRELTTPISMTLTPGDYWIGAIVSTAQTGSGFAMSMAGNSLLGSSATIGVPGSSINVLARDLYLGQGLFSASAIPSSVALSQIVNTVASNPVRAAFYHAFYSATY